MNPLKINSPSNSLGIVPLIILSSKIKHSQTHKKGPNHFFKPIHKLSHSKKSSSSNNFFKGKISHPMLSSSGKCFPQLPKNLSPTFRRATAFLSRAITKKSTWFCQEKWEWSALTTISLNEKKVSFSFFQLKLLLSNFIFIQNQVNCGFEIDQAAKNPQQHLSESD